MNKMLYDAVIVGGGPAGLSMAVAFARQAYTALVIDSGEYRNERAAHMHNVPGYDHVAPSVFRAKIREDLRARYSTISFLEAKVTSVKKINDSLFEATANDGEAYKGKKLGLGIGVRDKLEDEVTGYDECFGYGVFHCMFCHGYEERGSTAGVLMTGILQGDMVGHVSLMAKRLSHKVTVYTDGKEWEYKGKSSKIGVDKRKIQSLRLVDGGPKVLITFEDGATAEEGFIASHPHVEARSDLAAQLGVEFNPSGEIKVNMFSETSVKGCFAGGDIATMMRGVVQAEQMGSLAGFGMINSLMHELEESDEL